MKFNSQTWVPRDGEEVRVARGNPFYEGEIGRIARPQPGEVGPGQVLIVLKDGSRIAVDSVAVEPSPSTFR